MQERTIINPQRPTLGNRTREPSDAAYQSLLMQNHRLRVQLYLERKGISTINPPHAMLVYIADSFRLGFLPDAIAEHCETMLPIWEKDYEEKRHATRKTPRLSIVQSPQ